MKLINTAAVCEMLAVSPRELKHLRRARALPFYRVGHRTVSYSLEDIENFLKARYVAAKGRAA